MARKMKVFEIMIPWDGGNEIKFHPSFEEKMARQLSESGTMLLGEAVTNCICALIIRSDSLHFDVDGNGYIKGEVVDWMNFGQDVTVRWGSSDKKNIDPETDVTELEINFSWCEDLPVEYLKKATKKKAVVVDSTTYSFLVEYKGFIESDICLEISLENSEIVNDVVNDKLQNAVKVWNKNAEKNHGRYINYMSDVRKMRKRYISYFDLGSSGSEAIHFLIQSIEELGILKITVKQS
ncbi:hypothetical protein ACFVR2_20110 [Gottfriedia sp. NPDC057991]|uniref:hypothetical protein n=1 Tax=Gottfriedia sp. NPDC057991 TaxID=3346298 RepID=UPI0036D89955